MNNVNILLTSVGRRSYLVQYFKDALEGLGKVHVANSSEISPAFNVADYSVVTPLIYQDTYIDFLLEYCKENKISAIISLFDIDLPILSKNKKKFLEIGTSVIVSNSKVIDLCNDKWATYEFLIDNGFNAPKTFNTLESAVEKITEGTLRFPLIIKPRWGMGSIAVYEAENIDELNILYAKTKRNIFKTYLKYESSINEENCVLIQEKLEGQEYGLDIINDLNGVYQNTIVKLKYAMRSGETDCAITVDNAKLKNIGENISTILKHIGNLDVDIFVSDKGIYILEMNARFGGGYPFSHMAGVNLPLAIIKWLCGVEVEESILQERINIMSHKDISLVRMYSNTNMKINLNSRYVEILNGLENLQSVLKPSLIDRNINIGEYADKLQKYGKVLLLKSEDGDINGIAAAYMNNNESKIAYLTILALNKCNQGLQYGEKMLLKLEKIALTEGMKKMRLEVRKNNFTGIGFYKSMGYVIEEETINDSYYMIKEIK